MYDSEVFLRILQSRGIIISEPRFQNGGNSKIYKFTLGGERLILKKYLGNAERIKISKEREISAYKFLYQNNLKAIPKLYEEIHITDGICLEHVQGKKPLFNQRTLNEISLSISKLKNVFEKNSNFREATDACFTTDDVLHQIKQRNLSLNPLVPWAVDLLDATIWKLKGNTTLTFPNTTFTYSLSDVGPHNMISKGNKYTFIDFEFFGKDSAVKMIIDFLLHPKNVFPTELRRKFLNNAMAQFEVELDLVLKSTPFFAAKWAAIVARRMTQLENKTQTNDLTVNFKRYIDCANLENQSELLAKLMLSR